MRAALLFLVAGLLEIGGGYLVWLWLRQHRPVALGVVGLLMLALYGVIPVLQEGTHSFGRVYAAYGAVFIVLSMLWGAAIDHHPPDARDYVGAVICVLGAIVMMWPRGGG
jgi:small multidrug resistance family-3 protein